MQWLFLPAQTKAVLLVALPQSVHRACAQPAKLRERGWRSRRRQFTHRLLASLFLHILRKQKNPKWPLNAIGSAKPPAVLAFHIVV